MTMESLAEETLKSDLTEEEAVQYMIDNLDAYLPALKGTLRDVFCDVKQRTI